MTRYYQYDVEVASPRDAPAMGVASGKLADQLNLSGELTEEKFHELIDGEATCPRTGERLRKRTNREGANRVGLDLTFDTGGKSFSAYYAYTRDPVVLQLFEEAREETMIRDVEPRMLVRVRQGGEESSRITGNALWTSFPDLATRPTKVKDEQSGKWVETHTVDPHIHTHCYLFQVSFDKDYQHKDGSKGAYLSADASKIWASMPYIQQAFHARLFRKLQQHGFNVTATKHGIELDGWTEEMGRAFSRRTTEIEAAAEDRGITDAAAKDRLGKLTRSGKSAGMLTEEEQFQEWKERLPKATWDAFLMAAKGGDGAPRHERRLSKDQAIDYALAHTLERNNSATIEEVMQAALEVGKGLDVDQLQTRLLERPDVVAAKIDADYLVSTQEMLALEAEVVDRAARSLGSCLPLARDDFEFRPFDAGGGKHANLNDNQQTNLRKLLQSTSRFMTLRGAPGVGKTAALGTQLFRAVEENGGRVVALGSTSNARDQLIAFGAESGSGAMQRAQTLAKFLGDETLQQEVDRSTLIVLDETTLAGLKDLQRLTRIVEEKHARLLLVGDFRQLDAVPAHGRIFEQLSALGEGAEFTEIVRQRDPDYRRAAMLTSSGDARDVQAGFDKLAELGFVREIDRRKDRIEQAARAYLDIASEKKRRGKRLAWTADEKRNPALYRSGMTVIVGKGKQAEKLEVVGRDDGKVLVAPQGGEQDRRRKLDLSRPEQLTVYQPNYHDALLIVGAHKQGEAIVRKIRQLRKQAGELGIEKPWERLVSLGFSNQERQNPDKYEPGKQVVEFARKAKTKRVGSDQADRTIDYGEQFMVSGKDDSGRVTMTSSGGEELVLPMAASDRFDVYEPIPDRVAVGDKIRMTKGGRMASGDPSRKGVRFSNNDVFTIQGFSDQGDLILNNGHTLPQQWLHWRSGYYKTAMGGQGSTSSHTIFVDSKEAGRARSKESWLVAVTRGKHAATILTDDAAGLRRHAILRSSQRPSATDLAAKAAQSREENGRLVIDERRQRRFQRIDHFAWLATEATIAAIKSKGRQWLDQARQLLEPIVSPGLPQEPVR